MREQEVRAMVEREVVSIFKRDGHLPRNAYLWSEVRNRLSTLKPWEGMRAETVGMSLRSLVEEAARKVRRLPPGSEVPDPPAPRPPKKRRHRECYEPDDELAYT